MKLPIPVQLPAKKSKYRAVRTEADGIVFASKKEAARYQYLAMLWRVGRITHLRLQPEFVINVNGVRIGKYIADFSYLDFDSNKQVVEDVKGVRTPAYRLKKKLVEAIYGIEIREV